MVDRTKKAKVIALLKAEGPNELPLVTAGDDLAHLARFLAPDRDSYSAADVLGYLLSPAETLPSPPAFHAPAPCCASVG